MTRAPPENSFKMQSGKGGEPPYVAGRSDEKSTVSPRTTQNGRGEMKLKMKKNEKRMNKKKKKKEIKSQSSGSREIIRLLRKRRQRHQISIGARKSLKKLR